MESKTPFEAPRRKLREAGPGWQSQINTLLRGALKLDQAPAKPSGA